MVGLGLTPRAEDRSGPFGEADTARLGRVGAQRGSDQTALVAVLASSARADPHLQPGDTVAIIGDSITEQKMYSVFIEDYLLMCQPAQVARAMQFGWGGETAEGFKNRMTNDCFRYKPSVATT